jgi:hypothetical protein
MALQKQGISINFAKGIEQGVDPWQIPIGSFEELFNSTFDKVGRLQKRNGFGVLPSLPDSTSAFATTFMGNFVAIGQNVRTLSQAQVSWINNGSIQPVSLSTIPLVRNNLNQSQVDAAIAPNGLICTVYVDDVPAGSTTSQVQKWVISDSITGVNVTTPRQITSTFGTVTYAARVFSLSNNFIISFATIGTASAWHLQYMPVSSINPNVVGSVSDFSTDFAVSSVTGFPALNSFDGVVANNSLYLSWNRQSGAGIKSNSINSFLALGVETPVGSASGNIISVCADTTGISPVVWTTWKALGSGSVMSVATDQSLTTLFSSQVSFPVSIGFGPYAFTTTAKGGIMNLYLQNGNTYAYGSAGRTDYISKGFVTQTGSVDTQVVLVRSVGLSSKAFILGSQDFFLANYRSQPTATNSNDTSTAYQNTYFLMNSTGGAIAKLAYGNAAENLGTRILPQASVSGDRVSIPYLFKEEVQAVNKETNLAAGTQTAGIYSQLGINLAKYEFTSDDLSALEVGQNLNFNGGYLYGYDGQQVTENGFHLYPDNVVCSQSGTVGSMTNQQYFYRATYEWSDNQGNLFRSAPSIPTSITVASGFSQVVVFVPTLRVTRKVANPVKVVIYRWSTAQQNYYQVTSIDRPVVNSTSVDNIRFTDSNSDSAILGNNLLYTEGGVVENIGGPAFDALTSFDDRLCGIDSENKNALWFSKRVIQATPVDLSDLFTLFVNPNIGAQGPTGPMRCIAPMDDKLIIFKKNAIYFINGTGPDDTGVGSQYSQPTFITSVVGCENQNSIVMTPQGLMFQSDKGIWLLGRDLSTQYIGKEVDDFNDIEVTSALSIPETNQIRLGLANGQTLMYDYFVGQWGVFSGISNISSALYQNLHTFINSSGKAYQESPGTYLDGTNPVLMRFKTGWLNLAGLQGYQRAYRAYFLGKYLSPHIYRVGIAYDYEPDPWQVATVVPDNYSGSWGSGTSWGSVIVWGGGASTEQWQIGFERQQCQAFQLTFDEYFDSTKGEAAGAGLTLSGIQIVAGLKKSWPGNIASKNRTS